MLESAAENGVADAAKELVRLFYYGFHLKSDYTSAVRWQKKLIKIHIEQLKNNDSDLLKLELANELRFLTEIERNTAEETDSIDSMIAYCEQSIEICNKIKIRDVAAFLYQQYEKAKRTGVDKTSTILNALLLLKALLLAASYVVG